MHVTAFCALPWQIASLFCNFLNFVLPVFLTVLRTCVKQQCERERTMVELCLGIGCIFNVCLQWSVYEHVNMAIVVCCFIRFSLFYCIMHVLSISLSFFFHNTMCHARSRLLCEASAVVLSVLPQDALGTIFWCSLVFGLWLETPVTCLLHCILTSLFSLSLNLCSTNFFK